MKGILVSVITIGLMFALYFLLFTYQVTFNTKNSNQATLYGFVITAFAILIIRSCYIFFCSSTEKINWQIILFGFILWLPISILSPFSISNEHSWFTLSIYILFLTNFIAKIKLNLIYAILISFLLIEITVSLLQIFQHYNKDNYWLKICGSFPNSSILSCYLALHVPMLIFALQKSSMKKLWFRNGIYIIIFFIVLIIVLAKSRTGLINITITILAVKLYGFKKHISAKQIILLLLPIIVLCIFSYLLFAEKAMSTHGRFLILKISFCNVDQYFWFGTGLGKFSTLYPFWQHDYFLLHPNIYNKEFLLAGETYLAYNDLFQLFIEIGVLRFTLCTYVFYKFLKITSSEHKVLVFYLKLSVVIVLLSALTTYSLHMTYVIFYLGLCIFVTIFIIRNENLKKINVRYLLMNKVIASTIASLSCYLFFRSVQQARAYVQWKSIETKNNIPIDDKYNVYKTVYPYLSANGKFLKDYGKFLFIKGDYNKAEQILQNSIVCFPNFETFELLALTYQYNGKVNDAIKQYSFLASYVPNKFTPKYNLFKLYVQSNKISEANRLGTIIQDMPVKVPSPIIDDIKKEVHNFLTSNTNNHQFKN